MFKYLPEYTTRLARQWTLRIALVLDLIAVIGLYIAGIHVIGRDWWIPSLILVLVLLWSGFAAFQEEREKTDEGVFIEWLESKHVTAIQRMHDGRLWAHLPIRLRLYNRHPQNPARLVGAQLVWAHKRLLLPEKALHTVPLVDVDHFRLTHPNEPRPELDVAIAPATSSPEIELMFEDNWVRDQTFRWPRRSPIFIELKMLGTPNIRELVTTVDSPDWSHPNSVLDLFPITSRRSAAPKTDSSDMTG